MEKNKVEIIKCESSDKKCYICDGTGKATKKGICRGKIMEAGQTCYFCDGTGTFKDNHYILVVNGMAFPMDTIK